MTTNKSVLKWLDEMKELLTPDNVVWIDGSEEQIEALIEERTNARKNKDFKTADAIRDRLKEMGITLEDTPQGVNWSRS